MRKRNSQPNVFSFLWSKHPDYYWKQLMVYLAFILVVVFIGGRMISKYSDSQEAFSQPQPFMLQLQESSYDPFYAEIYDQIHPSSADSIGKVIQYIEKETLPSTSSATFLDVGCGTGKIIQHLHDKGYLAVGIDCSPAMVQEAMSSCGTNVSVKEQNVLSSPHAFEEDDFSHVLCLGPTTLYEICSPSSRWLGYETSEINHRNMHTFLKHINKWLRRGGYFVVQIEPLSTLTHSWVGTTGGNSSHSTKFPKQVTHPDTHTAEIKFSDVHYTLEMTPSVPSFPSTDSATSTFGIDEEQNARFEYASEDSHRLQPSHNPFSTIVIERKQPRIETVVLKETFSNTKTKSANIRQNEWHLSSPFSDTQDWVKIIESHGFALVKAGVVHYPNYSIATQAPVPQIYLFRKEKTIS